MTKTATLRHHPSLSGKDGAAAGRNGEAYGRRGGDSLGHRGALLRAPVAGDAVNPMVPIGSHRGRIVAVVPVKAAVGGRVLLEIKPEVPTIIDIIEEIRA